MEIRTTERFSPVKFPKQRLFIASPLDDAGIGGDKDSDATSSPDKVILVQMAGAQGRDHELVSEQALEVSGPLAVSMEVPALRHLPQPEEEDGRQRLGPTTPGAP
ncbi:hypothetical protein H920_10448 [Fukomys damarensis]|uniref:Uncharacterized protein n=1 Tax=Fukomys damarensis TaxID=885580 RepID=A0A091D7I0_FUKDA|nr:hypothetical protein H920_10448 [Fukomys damarensis]